MIYTFTGAFQAPFLGVYLTLGNLSLYLRLEKHFIALTSCRECSASVYELAKICPHCGAETPGTSREETQLVAEYESLIKEMQETVRAEVEYANRYRKCGFIGIVLGERDKYVNLANTAKDKYYELFKQKTDVEDKLLAYGGDKHNKYLDFIKVKTDEHCKFLSQL